MTKALSCSRCATIRTLLSNGQITECECGTVKAWWSDKPGGIARMYTESLMGRRFARVVGFHSGFLQQASDLEKPLPDIFWRKLHDNVVDAPGFMFDATRRACWSVIIVPGETGDTRWATDGEWDAKRQEDAARTLDPLVVS